MSKLGFTTDSIQINVDLVCYWQHPNWCRLLNRSRLGLATENIQIDGLIIKPTWDSSIGMYLFAYSHMQLNGRYLITLVQIHYQRKSCSVVLALSSASFQLCGMCFLKFNVVYAYKIPKTDFQFRCRFRVHMQCTLQTSLNNGFM